MFTLSSPSELILTLSQKFLKVVGMVQEMACIIEMNKQWRRLASIRAVIMTVVDIALLLIYMYVSLGVLGTAHS